MRTDTEKSFEIWLLRAIGGYHPVSGKPLSENSPWRTKEVLDVLHATYTIMQQRRSSSTEASESEHSHDDDDDGCGCDFPF